MTLETKIEIFNTRNIWPFDGIGDLLGVAEVKVEQPRVVEQPAVRRRAVRDEDPAFFVEERRDAPAAKLMQLHIYDAFLY